MAPPGEKDAWKALAELSTIGMTMVLSTVISRPADDRAIIDCGHKGIGVTLGLPEVAWPKGTKVARLSSEHGDLDLEGDARQLRPGDKVWLIPSHGGTAVNMTPSSQAERDSALTPWASSSLGAVSNEARSANVGRRTRKSVEDVPSATFRAWI